MPKHNIIFIFSVSVVLAGIYYWQIDMPRLYQRIPIYQSFIENSYSPSDLSSGNFWTNYLNKSHYRVLAPFLVYYPLKFFAHFITYSKAFLIVWLLFDLLAIFFSLYWLSKYLSVWLSKDKVILAILVSALVWAFTFKDQSFAPWSLLELGFISIGLFYIYENKLLQLIATIILATLNHNTSLFLILAYFLANYKKESTKQLTKNLAWPCLSFLSTIFILGTFRSLPLRITPGVLLFVLKYVFYSNISHLYIIRALINISVFFLPFLVFYLTKEKNPIPPHLKRLSWVAPFYLTSYLILGGWEEVRLLVILYPFLVPVVFY